MMENQDLREALDGYARAVRAKDVDGFVSLYATDVRVFGAPPAGEARLTLALPCGTIRASLGP